MEKIAVIGDKDLISGFAALGAVTYPVAVAGEALRSLKQIAQGEYQIVYVTEYWARQMQEELNTLSTRPYPVVVIIPDVKISVGLAREKLRAAAEKAIGTDALFAEKGK